MDKFVEIPMKIMRAIASDVTVMSDKPSTLQDGAPAQEVEIHFASNAGPMALLTIATRKGDLMVMGDVTAPGDKIGQDLKTYLYSLEFQPGFDEPVKLPPDVLEFLDQFRNDVVSHDLEKVMSHYSDRFLNSGTRKGEMEQFYRRIIGLTTSYELGITDFVPAGDRAYVAGFADVTGGKAMIMGTIINENGEWKFYGNQRDVAPE